jgi:hypothetical protein
MQEAQPPDQEDATMAQETVTNKEFAELLFRSCRGHHSI